LCVLTQAAVLLHGSKTPREIADEFLGIYLRTVKSRGGAMHESFVALFERMVEASRKTDFSQIFKSCCRFPQNYQAVKRQALALISSRDGGRPNNSINFKTLRKQNNFFRN